MDSNKKKSLLFVALTVLLWSTTATAFKLTLDGISPINLVFYSSLTSALIFTFYMLLSQPENILINFSKRYIKNSLALGILNPFLYYIVLFKAYNILPAQEAQPLNYTWPIVLSIFSILFLKQKMNLKITAGLLISFAGVLIIATRGNFQSIHFENLGGVILAVGSSLIWALFWVLNILDKRNDVQKLFSSFIVGTILIFLYIVFFDSFNIIKINYLFGAIYIGTFEMGITFLFWLKAISLSENKAMTSTLAYLSPFISLIFITLVLGEKLFLSSIAGLILIVGGILLQQIKFKKE
jgi:drug/metabolite transporter (DMT)-like permease